MYEEDMALNNLQWMICHKIQPNQTKPCIFNIYVLTRFGLKLSTMVDIP